MAQLTIYLSEELKELIRGRAGRSGQSTSAYIAALIAEDLGSKSITQRIEPFFGCVSESDMVVPENIPAGLDRRRELF